MQRKTSIKILFIGGMLIINISCFSQDIPKKEIQLIGGRSFNGSGDMTGISFTTEYSNYFKKHFAWAIGLNGTIHYDSYPIFFNDSAGNPIDGSIRETTSGVQIISHLGYSFVKNKKHELQIRIGGLVRFQSSSVPDIIIVLFPAGPGLPVPVNVLVNESRQNIFSLGASSQLLYSFMINKKVSIGVLAGFQFDTNGDHITQTSVTIGRHF